MYTRCLLHMSRCLLAAVCAMLMNTASAREEPFGRFRYRKQHWRSFDAGYCRIYYPPGNDSLAEAAAGRYPEVLEALTRQTGLRISGTPSLIIYPSLLRFYESNVGMKQPERLRFPAFKFRNRRMILTWNGSNADFGDGLQMAVMRCLWEEAPAPVQAQSDRDLPWFREGMIRYFALGWRMADEDRLYSHFRTGRIRSWEELTEADPALAGQALGYFLARKHDTQAPARVMLQVLKGKPVSGSLRLIVKHEPEQLTEDCIKWYGERFPAPHDSASLTGEWLFDARKKQELIRKAAPGASPGEWLIETESGNRRTIYVLDQAGGAPRRIATYVLPPFVSDYSADPFPLWEREGDFVRITRPFKGKIAAGLYDMHGRRRSRIVVSAPDGILDVRTGHKDHWLLAAHRRGQSDLVLYDPRRNRYRPLTNDRWEDGLFTIIGEQIYWESARPVADSITGDTAVAAGIFRMSESGPVPVVSETSDYAAWSRPQALSDGSLLARYNGSGASRFALIRDPGSDRPAVQILGREYPVHYDREQDRMILFRKVQDRISIRPIPSGDWLRMEAADPGNAFSDPWLNDYRELMAEAAYEDSMRVQASLHNTPSFLEQAMQRNPPKDSVEPAPPFDSRAARSYILQLHAANFSAGVNNDYFINRYQPYQAYQGVFKFPELGGLVQAGLSDLFEDHHVNIAFRLPSGMDGSDFMARYYNAARNINWGLLYFRKAESIQPDPARGWSDGDGRQFPDQARVKTHYVEAFADRPLGYEQHLHFSTALRSDRTIFPATARYSLEFPAQTGIWSVSGLFLRRHMLRPAGPMLFSGLSGRTGVDVFKSFTGTEAFLLAGSIDVGWHLPLYKGINMVLRGQAGYSAGQERILFNMGGVDNNLVPRIDSSVQFSQHAPYAFQTLITPFRGHYQNSLAGDRYLLCNADVYVPVFDKLVPLKTRIAFVRNFQPGVFADLAFAGEGWRMPSVPLSALASFGLSARTTLADYQIRFDLAWPGSFRTGPVWYLSLKAPLYD